MALTDVLAALHTRREGKDGPGKILVTTTPGGFENFMFGPSSRRPHAGDQ
jgi:hypothetical protein